MTALTALTAKLLFRATAGKPVSIAILCTTQGNW
jgi:hypothetical protein